MLTLKFAANEPHSGRSNCDHGTGSTKRGLPLKAEVGKGAIEPTALNEGEGQEFGVEASKAVQGGDFVSPL
jgi:hypothetical protein